MKILLISPVRETHSYTNKGILIPQLALFILEGLTPKKHEVEIVEEEYKPVDFNKNCDVVGISCMTSNAYRAYKIAAEFRKRGKIVILGGVHPSILPDEALQYADSVVIGEAEGVWEKLLNDIENNELKKKYQEVAPDLTRYIPKNFSLVKKKQLFNLLPIQTTRGCPYSCEFCCVSDLYGKKVKHVPVENVVRDIQSANNKNFIFLDDNIVGDRKYARELFKAIKPLKIRWIGQASISFAREFELMKMAKESGCVGLFIGLESVVESQYEKLKKLGNLNDTIDALKRIRKMGIIIMASVIFGFEDDTQEIFNETVQFLKKNKICVASLNILTPYPGTKVYKDFKNSGRLITENWDYYDHHTVVFRPNNMTPYDLQFGKIKAKMDFYKWSSIFKRLTGNWFSPVYHLASNYGYLKLARAEMKKVTNVIQSPDIDNNKLFLDNFIESTKKEKADINV